MMLKEYNEQKVLVQERKEGVQEGIQKGVQEGRQEMAVTVVTTMLKNGYTVPEVIRMTGLPENTVKSIVEKQNKPAMA